MSEIAIFKWHKFADLFSYQQPVLSARRGLACIFQIIIGQHESIV